MKFPSRRDERQDFTGLSAGTRCHPAQLSDEALLKLCTVTTGRTGGPGGQNRNKVETAAVITHLESGIIAQADERRSQIENKRNALRRLRLELAIHLRTPPPPPPKPTGRSVEEFIAALDASAGAVGRPGAACSDLWRSRVNGGGKQARRGSAGAIVCNPDHHDYPALLAEALDVIAAESWQPKPAAERLGVTSSQLVKFVKDCPAAMTQWNRERAKRGHHALK